MGHNKQNEKQKRLNLYLAGMDSILVALSGGVDSAVLLACASQIPGKRVMAVTAISPIHPECEKEDAVRIAGDLGVRHILIGSDEMTDVSFVNNPKNRCYICKKLVFGKFKEIAEKKGVSHMVHGANMDDLSDYRPGMKAADELGVKSPLIKAGLFKREIRKMAKQMGLGVWDKPAMACLATRIPYGVPVTLERIKMVGDAEKILLGLGFKSCRVRHHETIARIEVYPDEIQRLVQPEIRKVILRELKTIGYQFVAVDLKGYMMGGLNQPDGVQP